MSELNERYRVKRKELETVIEDLKHRRLAKSAEEDMIKEVNNSNKIEYLILINTEDAVTSEELKKAPRKHKN